MYSNVFTTFIVLRRIHYVSLQQTDMKLNKTLVTFLLKIVYCYIFLLLPRQALVF